MECGTLILVVSPLSGITWLDWGYKPMLQSAGTDRQLDGPSGRGQGVLRRGRPSSHSAFTSPRCRRRLGRQAVIDQRHCRRLRERKRLGLSDFRLPLPLLRRSVSNRFVIQVEEAVRRHPVPDWQPAAFRSRPMALRRRDGYPNAIWFAIPECHDVRARCDSAWHVDIGSGAVRIRPIHQSKLDWM
jgi:hypothetical protein